MLAVKFLETNFGIKLKWYQVIWIYITTFFQPSNYIKYRGFSKTMFYIKMIECVYTDTINNKKG